MFLDNRTVAIGGDLPHHRDHPPGPLRLGPWKPRADPFPKRCGDLLLSRDLPSAWPSRTPTLYTLSRDKGDPFALFEAHWADWDQRGRLVAAVGGRILAGRVTSKQTIRWRQLISTHEDRPTRMEAPDWAQHW